MKYIVLIILLAAYAMMAYADDLVMKNKSVLTGTITGATSDSVSIQTGKDVATFAKTDIDTIVFTHADILRLTLDRTATGKIANKVGDHVLFATPEGVQDIPNNDILQVQYNSGGELRLSNFPSTGSQFKNDADVTVWSGDKTESLYLRARIALHIPGLGKWRDQFVIVGGNSSPELGPIIGGEVGYAFRKYIQLGLGYEYYTSRDVKLTDVIPNVTDHVSYTFLYGGVRIGDYLPSTPQLFLYGSADIGSLTGAEIGESDGGGKVETSATTTAFRFGGGAEYYFSGNWSTSAEISYLVANVNNLTGYPGYELNFSGVSIFAGFSYHIPFR